MSKYKYLLEVEIKKVTGNKWYKVGEKHLVQPKILNTTWGKDGMPYFQKRTNFYGILCDDCNIIRHVKNENNDK